MMGFEEDDAIAALEGETAGAPAEHNLTQLNTKLNDVARNTDDGAQINELVLAGAQMMSTNGAPWYHTPLHQAAYHGREAVVQELIALLKQTGQLETALRLESNPCGRGEHGLAIELARGGGHHIVVAMLESACL